MNKDLAKKGRLGKTNSLASKGRFGDTEIRKVDGQPAHVNKEEAKLIDRQGILGEIAVKSQGAGTTNPETGYREYFPILAVIAAVGAVVSAIGSVKTAYDQKQISKQQFENETERHNKELKYLTDKHAADIAAYNRQWGKDGFQAKVFEAASDAYASQGKYLDDVFQSQVDKNIALKAAYTEAGVATATEKDIMARQRRIAEEGDPMQSRIAQEELSRATGAIRGQGTQAIQRAQGQAIGQGLEGSIVARELVRQVDRDTLKALSETARDMAISNQRAQMEYKREAQGKLDTMGLGLDARKRQSLLSIAGMSDPIKGIQGPTPVDPLTGKPGAPIMGVPGMAPVDQTTGWGDYATIAGNAGYDIAGLDWDSKKDKDETPWDPND